MSSTTNHSFEFGGFTLNANGRLLLYSNQRIELTGRDFDVLLYLIQNPKRLISSAELIAAVWGEEPKIVARNITHHIAKVRKALDCDPRHPTFIETVSKKGYRFLADVRQVDTDDERQPATETEQEKYLITSHMFVPMYLGAKAYDSIEGKKQNSVWASYKEFQSEEGRLCVLSNGIGVWHLTRTGKFPTMSVIARQRRETYESILGGKHRLSNTADRIVDNSGSKDGSLFPSKLSTPGYVFSGFVMSSPRWASTIRIRRALELLTCLTPLESKMKRRKEDDLAFERRILEEGFGKAEMYEFGVPGGDMGFASWDSVSYYQFDEHAPSLVGDLTEFEIALQATWWFAKCLTDELMLKGKLSKHGLRDSVDQLRDMLARLESIGASETPSQRTMIEAVLKTSRVERVAGETIKRYERL